MYLPIYSELNKPASKKCVMHTFFFPKGSSLFTKRWLLHKASFIGIEASLDVASLVDRLRETNRATLDGIPLSLSMICSGARVTLLGKDIMKDPTASDFLLIDFVMASRRYSPKQNSESGKVHDVSPGCFASSSSSIPFDKITTGKRTSLGLLHQKKYMTLFNPARAAVVSSSSVIAKP